MASPLDVFFTQVVSWSVLDTADNDLFGDEVYLAPTDLECFFIESTAIKYSKTPNSTDEYVADAELYCRHNEAIAKGDKVEYEGQSYIVEKMMVYRTGTPVLKKVRSKHCILSKVV